MAQLPKPHNIEPLDAAGATVADGTHLWSATSGVVDGLVFSVPVLLLPNGSTAVDVPADALVGTIILMKG